MTIIGGADGPTSVYIAPSASWINWFGLIVVALMLLPNVIYAARHKNERNKCTNKLMNTLEQVGRYACMFFMVFNIGISKFGFNSVTGFFAYLIGNVLLLLFYWSFWISYKKSQGMFQTLMLAILPTLIFALCDITLRHWLLLGFALLFGVSHIYVSAVNAKGGDANPDSDS